MEKTNPENQNNDSLVVSFLTIRRMVGLLGFTLPVMLIMLTFVFGACGEVQKSISHYYYTNVRDYFVGCLCAVALFLFSYKGYDKKENMLGKLGCLLALCVAFFPTSVDKNDVSSCIKTQTDSNLYSIIHFGTASILFLLLAYYSLFLFTKSSGNPTPEKLMRNRLYRICGWIMVACIVIIALYYNIPALNSGLKEYTPVFWFEGLALAAFGLSWLTKGETLLKDKD
jgi:hypothetical protein